MSTTTPQVQLTEAVVTPQPQRRMDYIDALRGLACFWVVLHHTFQLHHTLPGLKHLPFRCLVGISTIGWLGVNLFLVLSGFCLFYPLVRKRTVADVRLDLRDFARRRARRILPPYYAALFLFASIMAYNQYRHGHPIMSAFAGWKDIPMHLLMLHNLDPRVWVSIDGSFWSLALEWQLYIIFPILVWMAAKYGLRALLATTFIVSLLWQIAVYHKIGLSLHWTPEFQMYYQALPGRCFEFAAGMAAAAAVTRPTTSRSRPALLIAGLLVVPALWYILMLSRFGPLCDQIWGIIFVCLILALSEMPGHWFRQHKLLAAITWFGTISYSIYLVHRPLMNMLGPELFHVDPASESAFTAFGFFRILLIIGLGYGFFLIAERPFINRRAKAS